MCDYFEQNKAKLESLISRYAEATALECKTVSVVRGFSGNVIAMYMIHKDLVEIRQHSKARFFTISLHKEGQEPLVLCNERDLHKSYVLPHSFVGLAAAMILIAEGKLLSPLSSTLGRHSSSNKESNDDQTN